jgi:hypothetical protein
VAGDTGTPLVTWAQVSEGAFADLLKGFNSPTAQADMLIEATRMCESLADRRFAPFQITETQRAEAIDIEDALDAYIPLDATAQLGFSRAQSLGSTMLVRHYWLRSFPPRFPEYWTGALVQVNLYRSFSGVQTVSPSTLQYEPDTGHVRFQLGTFVPVGTTIQTTYTGGYTTVPADLVRACKYMVASIAITELDPMANVHGHDPYELQATAADILDAYMRG